MSASDRARRDWLDRFRSPDGSANAIPYLDGIRAFAVLIVFVRHAWGHSGHPLVGGRLPFGGHIDLNPFLMMFSTGVDLFFVLSGFLLARGFLRADFKAQPQPSTRGYLAQRILRIGPPYWTVLFLVVFFFTPSLIPAEAIYSRNGAIVLATHVVFGQTVYLPAFGSWGVETPFWTLTIEMIFYLVLPLVVPLFFRRRWMVTVPAALAASLLWLYAVRYRLGGLVAVEQRALFGGFAPEFVRFFLSHTFPSWLFHFAIGIAVCNVVTRREVGWEPGRTFHLLTSERAGVAWFVLGTVWVAFWMFRHGSSSLTNVFWMPTNYMGTESDAAREFYFLEGIPFAVGYGLVLLGSATGPAWIRRVLGLPAVCFVGVIGYSVYLVHMPMLYHLNRLPWMGALTNGRQHLAALLAAGGFVTLLLSTALFVAVERPSMLAAKRVGARFRRKPATASAPVSVNSCRADP